MSQLLHNRKRKRLLRWLAARRGIVKGILLALLTYVGLYCFLSAAGRWRIANGNSGEVVYWDPYGADFFLRSTSRDRLIVRGSFLGFVFSPLIIADRGLFHPPRATDSPEAEHARAVAREIQQHELDDRNERRMFTEIERPAEDPKRRDPQELFEPFDSAND